MKTEIKDISPTRKQIDVEIDAAAVRTVYDRISDNYAKAASVPVLPEAVQQAVEEHKLEPLGEPELNLENSEGLDQLGKQPISFNVSVEVLPEIKLGKYKGLEVARSSRPIKDEDVDRVIESLREGSATLEPVEDRGAQPNDTVTASFHGTFPNEPDAEPIKVEDVDVVLGGEGVVQEITDQLTGTRPDDEKTFTINYPPDFSAKGLAGKEVAYAVKVSAVRIKELPDLDDEWAQSLGDEIESLAQLRTKIRGDLEQQVKQEADNKMRGALMRQLVEAHEFELPERLVEHQTEHRLESVVRDMIGQGLDPRNPELQWDKARESLKEQASYDLRSSLLLEHIAGEEKIEVSDQEVEDEINAIAEASRQSADQVRAILTKQGGERSIAGRLRNRKALELLVENSRVTDEEWKEPDESEDEAQKQE